VVQAANIYFDGNGRTLIFKGDSQKTLDIMLPGATSWKAIGGSASFTVPGKSKF